MNFKVQNSKQLYTVKGNFSATAGEVQATENGYTFNGDGYKMTTVIDKHSSGVHIRRDVIENISEKPIELRAVLSKFTFNGGEYEVYTQYSEWCHENIGGWQKLFTEVGVGNDDIRTNVGSSPFIAIYNEQNGRGTAFHILAHSTWQMKVKKYFSQTGQTKTVYVEAGINEKGFSYTLNPGERLELPTILFYDFKNKLDMDAYKLHRYYNDVKPARVMPVVYDTWLSNFDNISYELLSKQLEKASELGAEYFVIDAGWFYKPYVWFDNAGDWEEETSASMMGRMKEFADKVRSYGLKFGLWFEIERAGLGSNSYKEHPEYYIVENKNAFVDFANPAARDFIFQKLAYNIEKYGIEFIKFDYNAELSFDFKNHSFIEYFNGYHEFLNRINKEHPEVYLENCASGGLRLSLASLEGFDSFWISDNHSLYSQLETFKTSLIRMPSRVLEKWLTISSLEGFTPTPNGVPTEKILASGNHDWTYLEAVNENYLQAVMFGAPIGISCDLTKLSEKLCTLLKENFNEFKQDRNFWANSECHILCDTQSVLVLQFNDKEFNEIKLFSFHKDAAQSQVTVYPVLDNNASYTLNGKTLTADEIDENGIDLDVNWILRKTATSAVLKKA